MASWCCYLGFISQVALACSAFAYAQLRQQFSGSSDATNGMTIAVSQGYNSKESALKGIESVKQNAPAAVIEDTKT
ncbi:MAG: hypothetical protein ACI81O_000176 [Cyclobacteriaceae bacterium]